MTNADLKYIRSLAPNAPELGKHTRVHLGIAKTEGRYHHTVVGGPQDTFRKCTVIGYRIEYAESAGVWPKCPSTVNVIATVLMNVKPPLYDGRKLSVHVSCLEEKSGKNKPAGLEEAHP